MGKTLYNYKISNKGRNAMLTLFAPAKINLVLEVLGKRDDGYHEIRSLIQTVNLYDTLSFELADDVIYFECNNQALQTEDNLVVQTAMFLIKNFGCTQGVKIFLEKQIPPSSGLGGGSSDAAITLLALNKLWNLKLQTSDLLDIAAQLGSDIPFFIHQGMALVKGRGEKVTPLPALPPAWFVLLSPPLAELPSKTAHLYSKLEDRHLTEGEFTGRAMESWSTGHGIPHALFYNTFDSVAYDVFPGLEEYRSRFEQAGATNIHVAGSGPTLFSPVDNKENAETLCRILKREDLNCYPVSTIVS
jgi:4-diphosphocytidyl-2-C-methyl-D-erythritol kinase